MSQHGLPPKVEAFIRDHIESVTLLDILCVLARDPDQEWSPDSIASELRSNPKAISESLKSLMQRKLLVKGSVADSYRLRGAEGVSVELVREVCQSFKVYHSRIIELIYSDRKNQKLRIFADAFRIMPKSDRGDR